MEYVSDRRSLEQDRANISFGSVAAMVAGTFLVSRTCFFEQDFPAGIALMAVLVSTSTLNIYLLPAVIIGIGSFYNSGQLIWGDMGAACGCAMVFLLARKVRFSIWQKMIIAGMITIIARNIYYIGAHLQYRNTVPSMLIEGVTVAVLCLIFQLFADLLTNKELKAPFEGGIIAVAVTFVLLAGGMAMPWVLLPVALLLVIFAGYTMGIMEGITAGLAAAFACAVCGGGMSGVVILTSAGALAGILKGHNRYLSCVCLGAGVTGIAYLNLAGTLEAPAWYCIFAPAMMMALPSKWFFSLDLAFSSLLKSDAYREKKTRSKVVGELESVRWNFEEMAAMFASSDNDRVILSYQFRGMAQAVEKILRNVRRSEMVPEPRFNVESAWAGYARNQGVSGDSYVWEDLNDGRFLMVLSDGMGKGQKAFAESSLVVNTIVKLMKAGMEVEVVLKILNSILLLQSKDEIFSTVDLGIINKKTGKLKLYKIGAATTFIKRKNAVESVKMPAMPLGIVDGLKVDYLTVALRPGDQVIMISDGVTDSKREDLAMNWLRETIGEIKSKDPQTMCDLVMNKAVENYGIKEKDDLTVLSVRVC